MHRYDDNVMLTIKTEYVLFNFEKLLLKGEIGTNVRSVKVCVDPNPNSFFLTWLKSNNYLDRVVIELQIVLKQQLTFDEPIPLFRGLS